MKKFLKILLIILIICPVVTLAACKAKGSYLISALPSESSFGSIEGADNKTQHVEGTKISLVANEKNSTNNPFICWIKDYKKVVSTSKHLSLTYNKKNAGHYTAVFKENYKNKMAFVYFKSLDVEAEGYSSINYQLKYALISKGSDEFSDFANGSFTIGGEQEQQTDKETVLYMGNTRENNEYKFDITVVLTNASSETLELDLEFNTLLNKTLFNEDGNAKLTTTYTQENINTTFTLNFEKITYELYHE